MSRRSTPWEGIAAVVALFVALAAADKAAVTASSPIDPPGVWRYLWIGCVTAAFVAYAAGVRRMWRHTLPLRPVLAVAVVMQLSALTGPLLFSNDAFAYWDYGRLAAIHHVDPYEHEPSSVLHPDELGYGEGLGTSIYGPGFTAASEIHARAVGDSVRAAEVVYRVAAAVGVIILILILALFAPSPSRAVAVAGWNPLLAFHFAGGGHNDIWMLLFVVGGMLLTRRARPAAGGAAWAASVFIKASALALLPLELAAQRGRGAAFRLVVGSFAIAVVAFSGLATLRYGTAWLSFFHRASTQLSQTSSVSLVFRLGQLGVSRADAKLVLGIAFAVGYVILFVRAWQTGTPRLGRAAIVLIFTPAWVVPWYGSWPVALTAAEDDRVGQMLTLLTTAYLMSDAIPLARYL